jgi:lipopolysaccharide export system permease protein
MLKNKIFQYFFIEFFKIFLIISLSFSLLIWFTQAARLLELITEFGNPIGTYVKYMLFSYPKIFQNTFLLNFIISMFFLFTKFENSNEIGIYWLSGISKKKIYTLSISISVILLFFYLFLSIFLTPWSSYKGRLELSSSKFSLINTLVKEKNFNSPLKGLTIYVEKNDNKGNLENIFIYEKSRTITAKKGLVLSSKENTFLELFNGTTQENNNGKINFINFDKTIFDFSKYQLRNVSYPKFKERQLSWLIDNLKNEKIQDKRKKEIREEINSRIIKPFLIILITTIISFNLYSNNEKINLKKLKFIIYSICIIIIILNEIAIGMSGESIFFTFLYIFSLLILFLFSNIILFKTLKTEGM